MSRCKHQREPDCPNLYYCTGTGYGETKADGAPMQIYSYYCLRTLKTKKIAHASQWSGSTPKWCPLGRDT